MRLFLLVTLFATHGNFFAQSSLDKPRPRLVVAIVVDQMRNEYIYRYWDRFGNDGFRRLVRNGYYFRNTHYNYIPTNTAPGHASIFTGTTPRHHGIIGNDWYDRERSSRIYCVEDEQVKPVGTESPAGKMSPHRLLSTTISDELRLATSKRGKVFAVALKDRAAVLPAGHMANGAFWLEEETGRFVTSSWYMNETPAWLKTFNDRNRVEALLSTPWNTLYPVDTYSASLPDDNNYEKPANGKERPVFPYDFEKHLKERKLAVVRLTPYGNTLTREFAEQIIISEKLGTDGNTDLISVSFSSTDIIGHAYGPRSVEIEDTYLRLDLEIAQLLKLLDKSVGKDNYLVFLTADHAACDVSSHLRDEKIPAGYLYEKNVIRELKQYCQQVYNDSALVLAVANEQVFLDEQRISGKQLDIEKVTAELCKRLQRVNGIAAAYPSSLLFLQSAGNEQLQLLSNGYHPRLSGNIAYLYSPGFMDYSTRGTSHGTGYSYDTHVPLLFYGAGIKSGESFDPVTITQIAPTVAELLRISLPSACSAAPLNTSFSR